MPDNCSQKLMAGPAHAGEQGGLQQSPPAMLGEGPRDLIALAESRFRLWVEQDLNGQCEAPRRGPNLLGWSGMLLDHRIARTQMAIRKRIEIYRQVSVEYNDLEMLSASTLDDLREALLRTLGFAKLSFLEHLNRMFAADGNVPAMPAKAMADSVERKFDANCVGGINIAIAALQAEGATNRLRRPARQGGCTEQPASSAQPVREELSNSPHGIADIPGEYHGQTTCGVDASFRKAGEVWKLSFDGKTVHLPNRKGMGYIAELLRRPHKAIEAAALMGALIVDIQAAMPGLALADPEAIKQVRATLKAKQSELAELGTNDWVRQGPLQNDIAWLSTYLSEVQGHRGRARKVAGTAQRSRTAVTTAVNRARNYICAQHPALGRHLQDSIRTGTSLVYAPFEVPDWQF